MSRTNLVSISISNEQAVAIDGAMTSLEGNLKDLINLTVDARKKATKMGAKSEIFCRQTLLALQQNPQIVPPSVNVADAVADLAVLDLLRPIFRRLEQLLERATDTEFALGNDLMNVALQGYGHLKVAGKTEGLKSLSKSLGERFAKGPRQQVELVPTPEPA